MRPNGLSARHGGHSPLKRTNAAAGHAQGRGAPSQREAIASHPRSHRTIGRDS